MENLSSTEVASWKEVLFRLSPDMLCIASLEGFFLEVNPAFVEILKYSEKELLGQPFLNLIHPEDLDKTLEELGNLSKGNKTLRFQNRYKTGDGQWKWISWRASPDTEKGLIFALARDITEEKKLADDLKSSNLELEKANKELDKFAYIVSHDLRAPLRGISSLADFIEEDLGASANEEIKDHLCLMKERVTKMNDLITGILNYSRAGREQIKQERVDAFKMVQEIFQSISPPPGMTLTIEGNLPIIKARRILLEQVFTNLIVNAIQHHDKPEGFVKVSAQKEGEMWLFSIKDNGPGIDPKYHKSIFRIFKSANTQSDQKGTGIGLALVQKIMEVENGDIWVDSETGQGACFTFSIPA